jgi:F0F1-type ATP synthase assembly protein I
MGAAARYTAVAMTLPSATLAGYLVGYGLDRWLGTTYLKIVCLIIGIVAGFYGLIQQLMKDMGSKDDPK